MLQMELEHFGLGKKAQVCCIERMFIESFLYFILIKLIKLGGITIV